RLLGEKLGIDHVVAVVGPSMGGMQALQWGVSHADFMDGLVALVPLARTPAWSAVIVEATRKAIMLDPAWNNGNYTSIPVTGVRTVTISPESVTGHFAAGGFRPVDVEQINTEVATFLDVVTRAGERLR